MISKECETEDGGIDGPFKDIPYTLSMDGKIKIIIYEGVVLKKGESLTPEELTAYCNDRMAYFAVPKYLEFRDTLPKTPTQRVEKYKLREEGVNENTWDREKAGYKLKR